MLFGPGQRRLQVGAGLFLQDQPLPAILFQLGQRYVTQQAVLGLQGGFGIEQIAGHGRRDRTVDHVEGDDGAGAGLADALDALHGRIEMHLVQQPSSSGVVRPPDLGGDIDIGALCRLPHMQVGRRILEADVDEALGAEGALLGQRSHRQRVAVVVGAEHLSTRRAIGHLDGAAAGEEIVACPGGQIDLRQIGARRGTVIAGQQLVARPRSIVVEIGAAKDRREPGHGAGLAVYRTDGMGAREQHALTVEQRNDEVCTLGGPYRKPGRMITPRGVLHDIALRHPGREAVVVDVEKAVLVHLHVPPLIGVAPDGGIGLAAGALPRGQIDQAEGIDTGMGDHGPPALAVERHGMAGKGQ